MTHLNISRWSENLLVINYVRFRDYRVIYECGIIILRMRRLREGHYVCRATNVSGTAITECYLKADDDLGDVFEVSRLFNRFGRSQFQTETTTSYVGLTGQDSVHQAFQYPAFSFRIPGSFDTQRFSRTEMTFERTSKSEQMGDETTKQYEKARAESDIDHQLNSFDSMHRQTVFTAEAAHMISEEMGENGTVAKGPVESGLPLSPLQTRYEAPFFSLPLADVVTEPVNFLELKCIVTGYPRPAIRWTFNDQEIHSDSR